MKDEEIAGQDQTAFIEWNDGHEEFLSALFAQEEPQDSRDIDRTDTDEDEPSMLVEDAIDRSA